MRLGGGKKHGRLWIADGVIDSTTVPSLDAIRARSTSSSQPIRPRPSPALQQVQALQAELQETKRQSQEQNAELTAQLQAQKVTFEAAQKQMAEMMVIMQSLGQASGVPVQFSAPPPPTPAATPLQSADSNQPASASPGDPAFPSPSSHRLA
ncbi:uncharacterized protein [Miscanthus floridulus]|uniref:uncharacterized protein n=1 Tax=Miscanthus floridulus TaxID=154761 RepID=UPI003457D1F4